MLISKSCPCSAAGHVGNLIQNIMKNKLYQRINIPWEDILGWVYWKEKYVVFFCMSENGSTWDLFLGDQNDL